MNHPVFNSFHFLFRVTLLSFLFSTILPEAAVSQRKEDVIYLTGGSVIHGKILKDSTSYNIRILSRTGDIWAFDPSEIDSIKYQRTAEYKADQFNQRGFEFGAHAELLMRSGGYAIGKAVIPGTYLSFGYRFKPRLSFVTETGIQFYEWMQVPVSAGLRIRSSIRAVSPFLLLRTGYTVPVEKRQNDWDYSYKSYGGIHSTLGIGLERIINESTSFLFSFSYHYQELNYHLSPLHAWVQERDRKETYSRLRISVGYVFK